MEVLFLALLFIGLAVMIFLVCLDFIRFLISISLGREIYHQKTNNTPRLTPKEIETIKLVFPKYANLHLKNQLKAQHLISDFRNSFTLYTPKELTLNPDDVLLLAASYVKLTIGFKPFRNLFLEKIMVYPEAFYFQPENEYHKGHFNPKLKTIALSWQDFLYDFTHPDDGRNIALHEFSHAIMFDLLHPKNNSNSAGLFQYYYKKIIQWYQNPKIKQQLENSGLIRPYAFTNSSEFLAVVIELYFEKPEAFENQFPKLFILIKKMLGQHQLFLPD